MHKKRPDWSRNNLPTFSRFVSPLFFAFPLIGSSESSVSIAHTPFPVEGGDMLVQVDQRLETVNCVWDAATALCGFIVTQGDQILRKCVDFRGITDLSQPFYVVEIGSGCGLVGVVAGKAFEGFAQQMNSTFHVHVIMTDLTDEVQVLQKTINANFKGEHNVGTVLAEPLPWGSKQDFAALKLKFSFDNKAHFVNLILATDIVYEIQHFNDLLDTLNDLCPRSSKTLMLMAMERRWSDVTGFWWTDCKRAGWKWELVAKESTGRFWWGQVEEIDFYWMWR